MAKLRKRATVWVCLSLAWTAACRAQQATLLADAHVSSAQPTVNSGSLSNLNVGGGYATLLQFDLGTLPASVTAAQITRATLRVFCNRADTPGTVSVQTVGGSWSESAVTYATLPALGAAIQSSAVNSIGQFVTFDVTSAVQGWVSNAASNNGLALTATSAVVQFDSKENDQTAHAPQLEISLAAGGSAANGATGATGLTGATGTPGVAGSNGATGLAGSTGLVGATGFTGAAGATGVTGYQGLTGVTGATGLGLVGITGATGAAGLQGATGVGWQGSTGALGVTGATGSPGLVYQGAYSSATNYALGDVVLFAGASYASLTASNHGNTPGLVPSAWGTLTAQGPIGLTGASGPTGMTGPQGLPGSAGPAGEQGAQGLQGIAGQAGAQGIAGVTGATGLQGELGPQGIAGPVGMSFQGAYSAGTNYAVGDGVLWQGAGWVSLIAGNHGNTPDQSPAAWAMYAAAGSVGVAGATGQAGFNGAAGTTGATGAAGFTGATGISGATGVAGMAYQGAYNSTANYALGDVVVFGGSSYASLTDANHGNTPSLSPSAWGLLAAIGSAGPQGSNGATGSIGVTGSQGVQGLQGSAGVQGPTGPQGPVGPQGIAGTNGVQGAQGPVGPQGIAGQAGAQGVAGVNGVTGPTGGIGVQGSTGGTGVAGATGASGATGSPGMAYQGAYNSATNYALGDVVVFGGSSYASLSNANNGNTPPVSPIAWGLLAALGATGIQGQAGVTGSIGTTGPQGLQGIQGSAGIQGPTGPQGPAGAQGIAGANGAQGAQGPQGVQGAAGQAGAQGVAGVNGATGATGSAGAAGSAGATGTTGNPGSNGATGSQGLNWLGAWASAYSYGVGDAISYGGASYVSLLVGNLGQLPGGSPSYWAVLATAGLPGVNGATGATGMQGATGSQGLTGISGAAGATGPTGAVGMNFRGAWNAGTNYGVNDAVTYGGSTYIAESSGTNQVPGVATQAWSVVALAGGAGPTGAAGTSASIVVGGVTTLAAGSSATVTNSGTSQAAVLNFGIPQGAAGAAGSSGSTTATGNAYAAMYHSVSYATTYYAVNAAAASSSESGSVLAWVPLGCTVSRLDVYSQQSGAVKVTLRNGASPSTMSDTTINCTPSTSGSCPALGSVVIPPGSFIDYRFDYASGTAAGVWTSLQCQ